MAWGSALLAGVLSFASPKESSQRKGDPKVGAGFAGPLRYSESRAAAELGLRPQTVLADCPRPSCVAQRLPRGPQRRRRSTDVAQKTDFHGQPEITAKNEILRRRSHAPTPSLPRKRESRMLDSRLARREAESRVCRGRGNDGTPASPRIVSPGPLRGAEQRRKAGGSRRGLSEGEARVPQPPGLPSSTGNRRSRHRPRVAFFLLTFSWRSKKK